MATSYTSFDSTPATLVADLKTNILLSSDWSNPAGQRVQATTTRGADMVLDLQEAAATAIQLSLAVYRTAALADKLTRFLSWRASAGATTDALHVRVSAGKEHLYFDVEGPRAGEVNAVSASSGSTRQYFFLGDLLPYFASDTVPAVVLVANTASNTSYATPNVWVSRNQGNTASWVSAYMLTLTQPLVDTSGGLIPSQNAVQRLALADGKRYMFPYVIFEAIDGLRGRIAKVFFCGGVAAISAGDSVPSLMSRVTYGAETFILIGASKQSVNVSSGPFGVVRASTSSSYDGPVLAIPYS